MRSFAMAACAPILLLGERRESELPWCVAHDLTCCVSEPRGIAKLAQLAARSGKRVPSISRSTPA